MFKVAVTDNRFPHYDEELAELKKCGAELFLCPDSHGDEILEYIYDADALLVNQFKMTANIIKKLNKCRIISRYGVGYDNVDLKAAKEMNIPVGRVPDYCFEEVGEHALCLLLAAARKLVAIDNRVRKGNWNIHSRLAIPRIAGSVLGIIGYGGTGRAFHRKASGLGFGKILVDDPIFKQSKDDTALKASFETVINESDYISLHIPFIPENKSLINASVLSAMKNTAVLINTSRGGVVDTRALINALKNGTIMAAGLDVFEEEPPLNYNELLKLDNAVLSDHCAYYSESSLSELKRKAALNIVDVLNGGKPRYPVEYNGN